MPDHWQVFFSNRHPRTIEKLANALLKGIGAKQPLPLLYLQSLIHHGTIFLKLIILRKLEGTNKMNLPIIVIALIALATPTNTAMDKQAKDDSLTTLSHQEAVYIKEIPQWSHQFPLIGGGSILRDSKKRYLC